jgi:hypothetical protein
MLCKYFVDDFISRVSFMPNDLTSKCSFQVLDGLFLMYEVNALSNW